MQALALLAFLLVAANLAVAQQLSPAEREILMLQDQRSLGDGKLVSHLSNADPRLRSRAAMALANLQDTSTVQAVLPLLKDPEAIVRESAAFALGQIGSNAAQDSLLTQLKIETNPDVLVRILEALGKV
ncbi:MAG: HEAT repeat domain-containing protein, partial [Ignavibacteria bacterium]|nr:HEAT repeat domain-containing protein [Ignavibacteria bacterium]